MAVGADVDHSNLPRPPAAICRFPKVVEYLYFSSDFIGSKVFGMFEW